jgi:hypothetical protein
MKILKAGCGCTPMVLDRMERRTWMRLLSGYRAYRCQTCQQGFLASKELIDSLDVIQKKEFFPVAGNAGFS